MKVVVLGGGISGTVTAYFLAKDGHDVTLIERRAGVAQETSFANGGIICPSMSEPWASPGAPTSILRWLGRDDAPLLLRLHALPGFWRWGLMFIRNCGRERYLRNARTNLRLALYSLEVFQRVRDELEISYDLRRAGSLKLYTDPRALGHALEECAALADLGLDYRAVDPAECVEIEPALASAAPTLAGGIYYPRDETGDCFKFAEAMAAHAEALGVIFRHETTIDRLGTEDGALAWVETDRGRVIGDRFVLAAGAFSPLLGRQLGLTIPIYPVKGVTLSLPIGGWSEAPCVAIVDEERKFGIVRLGERLRIAGSAEFTGYDATPDPARCRAILDNARQVFPELAACAKADLATPWAGLRPMTPDGPPILGPTSIRNLFINAGGGHLGWTFSCGAGRLVADLVVGERPEIDLHGLTLERFGR